MVVSTDSSRTMPDWVKYGVFWHVYPLGFCGADIRPAGPRRFHGRGLDAIIPWLEYVRDLGASGLLLGPVFESATHGYDTLDHMHIDVRLGGDAAFDQLVAACWDMGLQVMLDGVFNHVSRNHPAVQAALDETAGRLNPATTRGMVWSARMSVIMANPLWMCSRGTGIWWRWTIRLTRPLTMWPM